MEISIFCVDLFVFVLMFVVYGTLGKASLIPALSVPIFQNYFRQMAGATHFSVCGPSTREAPGSNLCLSSTTSHVMLISLAEFCGKTWISYPA